MQRYEYFIRRILLMIPTFIGITFVCFAICQVVPGGPVEQAIAAMKGGGGGEGGAKSTSVGQALNDEQVEKLREYFGFDKPIPVRYWNWLVRDCVGLRTPSYKWSDQTAWTVISSRFRVSLIFGLTGFLLSYIVCIPLGIGKALRDGGPFDLASSVVVFVGYSIPGFALGMLLKMLLCGTTEHLLDLFPVAGFYSENFADLGLLAKLLDVAWHMALPILCYMVGSFALLTILMKNSLLEQVGQDYIRTVLAKGGSARRAIWGHALRNALIPLATGIGGILSIMFAGSVLIERVFEIPGMGMLSLDAIVSRDYPVFMAILALTSVLGLFGNIVQDFCYTLIDPRITFESD